MNKQKVNRPPRLANYLLSLILFREEYMEKSGDLEETYFVILSDSSKLNAVCWYWYQVIKAVPTCIFNSVYWGATMLSNYFKIALRNIKKYKAYSFINIMGLAVGMACCILILLWAQDELSYNTFHENKDDIHIITITTESGRKGYSAPYALLPILKNTFPEVNNGTWYAERETMVKYNNKMYNESFVYCMPDFLEMFTFPLLKGNKATALENTNSILISEKTAKKYFGSENPLGKVINISNRHDLTVTGVFENVPRKSDLHFDLITRSELLMGKERLQTWSRDFPIFIQLTEESSYAEFSQKLALMQSEDSRTKSEYLLGIQPLNDIHLYALEGTDPITYVYLFTLVAFVILLIACINFTNLSTARSAQRAKEIGLRKVIGANKNNIIKQFFGESILFAILALASSLILVYLFLPYFNDLAGKQLSLAITQNSFMLLTMIVITLLTGIVSGIYPAIYLSKFQPVNVMRASVAGSSKRHLLRRALIVSQFAAAIILIVSTFVILKQVNYIVEKDLGLNRDHIVTIRTSREVREKYDLIKSQLLRNKNITHVTSASSMPIGITNGNPVYWEGRSSADYESINFVCVDYDYFETFDMTMAYGRSFSKEFPTDMQNYIINEAALRMTGYEDPIGRMFSMWTNEGEIVGVVKDFNALPLHYDINPIVFLLYQNLTKKNTFIRVNPVNLPSTIEYIENTFNTMTPDFIFEYSFLDDHFNAQYEDETRLMTLLEYFTLIAIFISCLGLMGLSAFMAEQKTKEIAIRKVLGASINSLFARLSKEFIILVSIANLIAWPAAYFFMNEWIKDFTYRIDIGIFIFIISGIISLFIALITVSYQAYKAANRNPVDSLKHE